VGEPFNLPTGGNNVRILARAAACNAFVCGTPSEIGYSDFFMKSLYYPQPITQVTSGRVHANLDSREMMIEWETHFGAASYTVRYRGPGAGGNLDGYAYGTLLETTAINSYTLTPRESGTY